VNDFDNAEYFGSAVLFRALGKLGLLFIYSNKLSDTSLILQTAPDLLSYAISAIPLVRPYRRSALRPCRSCYVRYYCNPSQTALVHLYICMYSYK
jgi:hypothetical protein